MKRIFDNISQSDNDSEIIREIERVKRNDHKFDINCVDKYNCSLLMVAVDHGREDLVRYLLLMYPDINVNHKDYDGNIALHLCEQVSILKLLLGHRDLDVNIQNKWRDTGLHWLCYGGYEALVKEYLLDARINTSIRNKYGETARDYALEQGYTRIAKIINNSRHTTLLRIPNASLLYDIVRMIIEEYA